jgi:hypothetical protein
MNNDCSRASALHGCCERLQRLIVCGAKFCQSLSQTGSATRKNSNAHLDGNWHPNCRAQRPDAVGDAFRLSHQTGSEGAGMHAVARASTVQVYFAVTRLLSQLRSGSQPCRIAAPQLQREWLLFVRELQESGCIPPQQRFGSDHFRIEQNGRGESAQEETAMPIRPIHHWRDRQATVNSKSHFLHSGEL